MTEHDLIVIGGGPGGYVAAIRAAQLGLDVACVDKNDQLGGTCLRVGCIPSKALLDSTHKLVDARDHLADHGIAVGSVKADLARMLQRKDQVVDSLTKGIAALLKKNKVTHYQGLGRLAGQGQVVVDSGEAETTLHARHILLATGSVSATLPGVELDERYVGTSTEALSFDRVPEHLVVIGGGYIGLELGVVWRRLGAKVTVLEYLDRILYPMDSELAKEALRQMRRLGLEIHFGAKVTRARAAENGAVVEAEGREPLRCDRVLLAVGRKPFTKGLNLEALGIRTDAGGRIEVDEHFATNVEGVWAIGDVIRGPMLAHKAEHEGIACAENIAHGKGAGHVNYDAIPAVVFTHPEIASVGRTEDQLKEAGVAYRKGVFQYRANGRARALGETDGFAKVLADAHTDRLLGVHILGAHAGDLIPEAAAAMEFSASSEDLASVCHPHPTLSEILKEAALAVRNQAIHA